NCPARSIALLLLPATHIGGDNSRFVGGTKLNPSVLNVLELKLTGPSAAHTASKNSRVSSVIRPRSLNGTPNKLNSSSIHPDPTPIKSLLSDRRCKVA